MEEERKQAAADGEQLPATEEILAQLEAPETVAGLTQGVELTTEVPDNLLAAGELEATAVEEEEKKD